jgi:hypothetical protein
MKDLKDYSFDFLDYGTVESGREVQAFWITYCLHIILLAL